MTGKHRLTLTISQKDSGYAAWLRSDSQPNEEEVLLEVSRERLQQLNWELVENLSEAMRCIGNVLTIDSGLQGAIYERFRWLANLGDGDLREIFPRKVLNQLRTGLNAGSPGILEIVSNDFMFPWELLYDSDDGDEFQYERFWGFRHIIYRHILTADGDPEPEIKGKALFVGLLADMDLASVAQIEVPFLRTMQSIKSMEFPCGLLSKAQREVIVKTQLRPFFSNGFHFVHFACHTRQSQSERLNFPVIGEPRDEYGILLSKANDFCIWPREFLRCPIPLADNPLIILNACGTSPRDPLKTGSMVRNLRRVGARGVITTECDVPDALAAAFTLKFYPLVLSSMELGQALLETRRHYLAPPYRNPFGLLYALFASPSTRFTLTT